MYVEQKHSQINHFVNRGNLETFEISAEMIEPNGGSENRKPTLAGVKLRKTEERVLMIYGFYTIAYWEETCSLFFLKNQIFPIDTENAVI